MYWLFTLMTESLSRSYGSLPLLRTGEHIAPLAVNPGKIEIQHSKGGYCSMCVAFMPWQSWKIVRQTMVKSQTICTWKTLLLYFSQGNLHRPIWFHKHLPITQYMSSNMLKQRKRFQKLWLQALHCKTCAYEMFLNCISLLRNYEKPWFALFHVSL